MAVKAKHALESITAVNYGVIVECRCGWVEHVTHIAANASGREVSFHVAARARLQEHKKESTP